MMDHRLSNNFSDDNEQSLSTSSLEALNENYQIFLIILYSLTACFAFISNLLTIIILCLGKRCTRDLKKFIINLSITDLLMAIFTIPFTYTNYMLGRWIFFPSLCPIVNFAQLTTITVSIYTLIAIAIDRYMAIMHPLEKYSSWYKRHRTLIILIIWLMGISLGISQYFASEIKIFIHNKNEYLSCDERWEPQSFEGKLYTAFIFATTFALPMITLSIIYTIMGLKLMRYRSPQQHQQCQHLIKYSSNNYNSQRVNYHMHKIDDNKSISVNNDTDTNDNKRIRQHTVTNSNSMMTHSHHFESKNHISNSLLVDKSINKRSNKLIDIRRNKVLKMLITIIGVFTVCWLPIQIFNLLIYFKSDFLNVNSKFKYYAFVGSYFVCHWISMAHSFMNPIIYSFMSKNFRADVKMIFTRIQRSI